MIFLNKHFFPLSLQILVASIGYPVVIFFGFQNSGCLAYQIHSNKLLERFLFSSLTFAII